MAFMKRGVVYDLMKSKGFKLLGQGGYSLVYQSPRSKEVLKLFHNDEGYKLFIKTVAQNKQCIHFPQFRSYYQFPKWDDWYAIKLEPLERISDTEWMEYSWLGTAMRYHKYDDWTLDIDKLLKQRAIEGMKKYPTLNDACRILEKARISSPQPWPKEDIHGDNLMKRANGTIVIIDPFS